MNHPLPVPSSPPTHPRSHSDDTFPTWFCLLEKRWSPCNSYLSGNTRVHRDSIKQNSVVPSITSSYQTFPEESWLWHRPPWWHGRIDIIFFTWRGTTVFLLFFYLTAIGRKREESRVSVRNVYVRKTEKWPRRIQHYHISHRSHISLFIVL